MEQLLQFGAEENRAHFLSVGSNESRGKSRTLCDLFQYTLEECRVVGDEFKVRKPIQKSSEVQLPEVLVFLIFSFLRGIHF